MYTGTDAQADLTRQLVQAQEVIDSFLRDEKIMAYPTDCNFDMAISESFNDFCQNICNQYSRMSLDKCLQDVPIEEILSEPLEAIIQRTVLCHEYVNTCF